MENYYTLTHPSSFSGIRRSKKPIQWLEKQRAYSIHKPIRRRYPTRQTRTSHANNQWQADLIDLSMYKDGSYKYILSVIDVFSRYGWVRALKSKHANEIKQAFASIFRETKPPTYLQTDDGTEFFNRIFQSFLKQHDVHLFSVKSQFKAAMCEKFNRTLKTKLFRYFTYIGKYKWVNILPDLIEGYNAAPHRSLPKGMSPKEAYKERNHSIVWEHQEISRPDNKKQKYNVGDHVRISKVKSIFEKGYLPNWTEEIFTVKEVDQRYTPAMYVLQDEFQKTIQGKFYAEELQKVPKPEYFAIDRVIRRRGRRALVKFVGYPGTYWVDDIQNINNV